MARGATTPGAANRRRGACAGLTLVEILIALTLVAIVAAISTTPFLRNRPIAEVRNEADRLANALRSARFRAVNLRRDVYFEFDAAAGFYTAYADMDDDPATVPTGTPDEVSAVRLQAPDSRAGRRGILLPASVQFDLGSATTSPDPDASPPTGAVYLPENPIVFRPRGIVRWPDGTLQPSGAVFLRHRDDPAIVFAVVIQPTGHVETWRRTGNGGWQ